MTLSPDLDHSRSLGYFHYETRIERALFTCRTAHGKKPFCLWLDSICNFDQSDIRRRGDYKGFKEKRYGFESLKFNVYGVYIQSFP